MTNKKLYLAMGCCLAVMLGGCAGSADQQLPPQLETKTVIKSGRPMVVYPGFLPPERYPAYQNSIPKAPADNSLVTANDRQVYKDTRKLKGTQEWSDAAYFAFYSTDVMCEFFSRELGLEISAQKTPWTYYIVARAYSDAKYGGSKPIKKSYFRTRPYVFFKDRTCSTQVDDDEQAKTSSYPSNHSTYGNLLGLIFSELLPEKQLAAIDAGRKFAFYRVVCGYHWLSDTEAAALVAGYVFARLQADPEFNHAMQMAKAELSQQVL
ncbi:MAG: phosphatase PAP2 family protein [Succinivibrio sp.]|nr:phosphatase PAP2 family protein [Succinivibrio sp.]